MHPYCSQFSITVENLVFLLSKGDCPDRFGFCARTGPQRFRNGKLPFGYAHGKMQQNHASSADLAADPNKSALGRASHIPLACTPASVAVVPFSNLPCRPTGGNSFSFARESFRGAAKESWVSPSDVWIPESPCLIRFEFEFCD